MYTCATDRLDGSGCHAGLGQRHDDSLARCYHMHLWNARCTQCESMKNEMAD